MIAAPTTARFALAALAMLSLAACSDNDGRVVAKGICTPFAATPAAATTAAGVPSLGAPASIDASGAVEDCLHRWAYSLAGARDSAEVVAGATVAACAPALSKWNQASLAAANAPGAPSMEAISLVTGEPTNALAEHRNFAETRALFFVVQARAGNCKPPPPVKAAG